MTINYAHAVENYGQFSPEFNGNLDELISIYVKAVIDHMKNHFGSEEIEIKKLLKYIDSNYKQGLNNPESLVPNLASILIRLGCRPELPDIIREQYPGIVPQLNAFLQSLSQPQSQPQLQSSPGSSSGSFTEESPLLEDEYPPVQNASNASKVNMGWCEFRTWRTDPAGAPTDADCNMAAILSASVIGCCLIFCVCNARVNDIGRPMSYQDSPRTHRQRQLPPPDPRGWGDQLLHRFPRW